MKRCPHVPTTLRRPALALLCGLLAASACVQGSGGVDAASRPVPLDRMQPHSDRVGAFQFRGAVEIFGAPGVGGLSGLAITDGGRQFVAVSDVGDAVLGRLHHENGRLTGVGDLSVKPLSGIPKRQGAARENDAEDLVALPDGGWLVAFEGNHRILRYPPGLGRPDGEPVVLPPPPGIEKGPLNGGMEGLARLPDGRLVALVEGPDDHRAERTGWIAGPALKAREDWQRFTYRAAPGYRTSGAATLPNGDLLVLERRFSFLGGFGARIARVPLARLVPGATVEGEELARLEPPLLTDNFEGIAAVPGKDGETLVYVVSDNNFNALQRTYLVMLALPADTLARAR